MRHDSGLATDAVRLGRFAGTSAVFAVTPEQIIASDGIVSVVQRYTGTATTGRKLDLVGVGVWDVEAGKIVRYRQFVDTVKFREVVMGGTDA
jgi:ketosteroid isomerase-like protein